MFHKKSTIVGQSVLVQKIGQKIHEKSFLKNPTLWVRNFFRKRKQNQIHSALEKKNPKSRIVSQKVIGQIFIKILDWVSEKIVVRRLLKKSLLHFLEFFFQNVFLYTSYL